MNLDEVKERAGVKVQCDSRCGCIGVYQGDKVNCFDEVDQFVMIIHRGKIHGQWIEHPDDERRARAVADAWNDRLDLLSEVARLRRELEETRELCRKSVGRLVGTIDSQGRPVVKDCLTAEVPKETP